MPLADAVDVEKLQKKIAELIEENKSLKKQKKFGFVWEDKPDAQVLRVRNEAPMLCEDPSKAVVGDTDATNHILINGDNFHALTALRATHMSKVDVIYIDPPYNTGNKDFIYNDNFLDKEDGYRHSKWLSFIEKRLTLAKELLSDAGVIFVSIDDNEQARLKLLMDEVFGVDNFIANAAWQRRYTRSNDAKGFSNSAEYVLVYSKNSSKMPKLLEKKSNKQNKAYTNSDNDPRGPWKSTPLHAASGTEATANKTYIFSNGSIFTPPVGTYMRFSNDRLSKLEGNNEIYFPKKGVPSRKTFLSNVSDGMPPTNFWKHEDFGNNQEGNLALAAVLGGGNFNNPKPLKFIKQIVSMLPGNDSIILDFFAGSGTTAHAVAELNKEDGGSRQCILVTDGGKTEVTGESAKNAKGDTVNIAEEITYERVRRVLTGKDWADGKEHEPLGGNLRYFKVVMEQTPQGATERDQRLTLEKYTIEQAKIAEGFFDVVSSKYEVDDETLMAVDYKVFAAGSKDRYLVGVNSHDYVLSDLEAWFTGLPVEAKVIMVGNGVEEIDWVKNNSNRIQVDDVLGRAIRSRKYVASKLPLG